MKLSLITNKPEIAKLAEDSGIDRIFIDLEKLGKAERQIGCGLFLSDHCIEDIPRIRKLLHKTELLVRIDPLHPGSKNQIAKVIDSGANILMLPYFHRLDEVQQFLDYVDKKVGTMLLVETQGAVSILGELTKLPGVSEIHIGLNDLSICREKKSLFELVSDGTIDSLCDILRSSGIPFGFGGIAALHRLDLQISPELFLAFQVCNGCTRGWLGRSFRDINPQIFDSSVRALRDSIASWQAAGPEARLKLKAELLKQIHSHHP